MEVRARTLRLSASSAAELRRGTALVQSALHVASLADDGRLYVVRRLPLGVIARDQRPERLSTQVERRFAELRSKARHGAAPFAETGEAVWFHDRDEALCLLLTRLLAGQRVDAWFWPLVLPALRTARGRQASAAAALRELAARPGAASALTAVVERALSRAPEPTLAALLALDLGELAQVLGLSALGLSRAPEAKDLRAEDAGVDRSAWRAPDGVIARALPPAQARFGADRGRVVWLAATAWLAHAPGLAATPARLLQRAWSTVSSSHARAPGAVERRHRALERPAPRVKPAPAANARATEGVVEARGEHAAGLASAAVDATSAQRGTPPPLEHAAHDDSTTPRSSGDASAASSAGPVPFDAAACVAAPVEPERITADDDGPSPAADWRALDGEPTQAGGLLFLLRVLEALGLPALLEDSEPMLALGLPARVLLAVARQLGVAPDDAMYRALSPLTSPGPDHAFTFSPPHGLTPYLAPRSVRRFVTRPSRVWPRGHRAHEASLARVLAAFVEGVERFCREHAEVGLAEVVLRPAQLSVSPMHLDVELALHTADVRLRIAGLDVDPGWVPWLGRVVLFHYRELRG